jgi:myo-inositol-1(or 4)-monophosphatase
MLLIVRWYNHRMQPKLQDLIDIAQHAGGILRSGFGKQHHIEFKGEIDLVTEIDHQSEEYILGELTSRFADHHIFSEESGERAGSADDVWYIDPLDGTLNYSHGLPIFCVSIAYAHKDHLQLAAVYDPIANEMYTAERGQGARLNDAPIHVSQSPELKSSMLVTVFGLESCR